MKRLVMFMLFTWIGLGYLPQAQAEDPTPVVPAVAPVTAPMPAMDTDKDGKIDADETAAEVSKETGMGDVVSDITAIVDATKGLKDTGADKAMVWMMILASVFKLLLSGLKLVKGQTKWFEKKQAKRIIKYSTLGLGAGAALLFNLAFGMNWMEAAMILLSGPVAVAIHEYTKDSKDTPVVPA